MNLKDLDKISPERRFIAKVFKKHIENAIAEIGTDYDVTLQGRFDKTPIELENTSDGFKRRNT
jgi:hypothetical protein